jgi:RTX calcium-binding nonapeptide repeat (4 copies)
MRRYVTPGERVFNRETINDDVTLEASGIIFTNTEAGRVIGNIAFLAGGSTLVNEVGGYIGAGVGDHPFTFPAITGSDGADTVTNAGTIAGTIDMADGDDRLTSISGNSDYTYSLVMGGGNDVLRLEGTSATFFAVGEGGSGFDTFEYAASTNGIYGTNLTGFEKLFVQVTGNYSDFDGYLEIVGLPSSNTPVFYNFIDSANPLVALALNGAYWIFYNSTLASAAGSDAADSLSLGGSTVVSGAIALGAGQDTMGFEYGATAAASTTTIDGGAGDADLIAYLLYGASITDSLADVTGFERIRITNLGGTPGLVTTLADLSGITWIDVSTGLGLVLASGDIAQAALTGAINGSIRIEAGLTVAGYSFYDPMSAGFIIHPATPDFRNSTTITNLGTITGEVIFYNGDDLFDGTGGTTSGEVHGHAGNDRLLGGAGVERFYGGFGADLLEGNGGNDLLYGDSGGDRLDGGDGADSLWGGDDADRLTGGAGNDALDGGSNVDTAILSGARSAYTITQGQTGQFTITGDDGTDTLSGLEYLRFADETVRLVPGTGTAVNFAADRAQWLPALAALRDFDGNDLGSALAWKRIGAADVNGDGDVEDLFTNATNGRFATVGTAADGLVYFADHGWAGETRVAGIYIDPLVASGTVAAGSDFDSQRRFQNDLTIGNIARILGADDYDGDGLQEIYFALTDGTAFLHAYMHADGNIRYANYQIQEQVEDYLTDNGVAPETWADWF